LHCAGLAQQRTQRRQAVFGHAEHRVARAILRHPQHRRAGRQHGAGFGVNGRHHARHIGHQHCITGLVALHTGLGARLLGLGTAGFQAGLAALELQAADEALVAQLLVALVLGLVQRQLGVGGADRSTGSILAQLQITGVDLGQHLARLHHVAHVDRAPHQLAADPEGQPRFGAGTNLGGIFVLQFGRTRLQHEGSHGPDGLDLRGRRATGHQNRDHQQGQQIGTHGDRTRKVTMPTAAGIALMTDWSVI